MCEFTGLKGLRRGIVAQHNERASIHPLEFFHGHHILAVQGSVCTEHQVELHEGLAVKPQLGDAAPIFCSVEQVHVAGTVQRRGVDRVFRTEEVDAGTVTKGNDRFVSETAGVLGREHDFSVQIHEVVGFRAIGHVARDRHGHCVLPGGQVLTCGVGLKGAIQPIGVEVIDVVVELQCVDVPTIQTHFVGAELVGEALQIDVGIGCVSEQCCGCIEWNVHDQVRRGHGSRELQRVRLGGSQSEVNPLPHRQDVVDGFDDCVIEIGTGTPVSDVGESDRVVSSSEAPCGNVAYEITHFHPFKSNGEALLGKGHVSVGGGRQGDLACHQAKQGTVVGAHHRGAAEFVFRKDQLSICHDLYGGIVNVDVACHFDHTLHVQGGLERSSQGRQGHVGTQVLGRPNAIGHQVCRRHLGQSVRRQKMAVKGQRDAIQIDQGTRRRDKHRACFGIGHERHFVVHHHVVIATRHAVTRPRDRLTPDAALDGFNRVAVSALRELHDVARFRRNVFRDHRLGSIGFPSLDRRCNDVRWGLGERKFNLAPQSGGCKEEQGCKNCSHGKNLIGFVYALRALFQKGYNSVGLVYFCAQAPRP